MYTNCKFSFQFVITLCLCWCEIETVRRVDDLDFWVRDPNVDNRRANEHKNKNLVANHQRFRYDRSKSENNIEEIVESESKHRFNQQKNRHRAREVIHKADPYDDYHHGHKSNPKATQDHEDNKQRGHDSDQSSKRNREEDRNWNRGHESRSHGKLRRGRHREDDGSKWPKAQRHRPKDKSRRDYARSTRMTPMYLMQQPPEGATTKKDEDKDEKPAKLSAYSIHKDMLHLMSKFPEANVTDEIIGRTPAYNDIVMFKITASQSETEKYFRAKESKYIDEVPEKKIVFIVHGLSVMGMKMIPCLSENEDLMKLISYYLSHLDKFDIFFIPMANPDGFSYYAFIWNKNISPQSACPGVSLDRNFDVAWNTSKPISSCSQQYPGPLPFSETETKAIRDVFHRYSHKIIAYLHVHGGTYDANVFKGDAVLYPKGYTDVQTDDDKYLDLRGEIDEAMKNASFQIMSVTVDSLCNWYGKVVGTSVDYAATIYGIPYAMELVMQVYDVENLYGSRELISYSAMTEIWKRLIDVIFNNIWRNTHANEI